MSTLLLSCAASAEVIVNDRFPFTHDHRTAASSARGYHVVSSSFGAGAQTRVLVVHHIPVALLTQGSRVEITSQAAPLSSAGTSRKTSKTLILICRVPLGRNFST
jgi:hypothetical protein